MRNILRSALPLGFAKNWVLAAARPLVLTMVFCGASVFTSCTNDTSDNPASNNLAEKIQGKWMAAETNGKPVVTNSKQVLTYVSDTKLFYSLSISAISDLNVWVNHCEGSYKVNGNTLEQMVELPADNIKFLHHINVTSITDNEMLTVTNNETFVNGQTHKITNDLRERKVRVTHDYSDDIIGTWEGRLTSEQDAYSDGQLHRWEYKADGTYAYYRQNNQGEWIADVNTMAEYFVDGTLLCSRWKNVGDDTEKRESWEIASIENGKMKWTALRQSADGSTYTTTFEMTKVKEPQPQALQVGSYVWGSTIYDMGADGATRLAEAYEKAGIQHAILLVKGESGTAGYFNNNLSNTSLTRTDRDILAETVSAMHERSIKVYAWLTVGSDKAWLTAHPKQGSYHFRRGFSNETVDLYQTEYQEHMASIMKEIEQNYDVDGFAIDKMRYNGIYWGWSDSDYQRLTAPESAGGYGLTLDEYNQLVTVLAKEYNYPTAPDASGRLVYSEEAEAPGSKESGAMENAFKRGVKGVVAFAKMREKVVDDFSEYLVSQTQKPVYVASMSECTNAPTIATLAYGMTYNQAYTFDVVCPMLYSADYSKDSQWVGSNISYLKNLGYKTVIPSLQAYRSGSTETLAADIKATLDAGCRGYLLFRTSTYDMARCTTNGNTMELTYVRGTDNTCGNLTVTVSGVTPTSVTMGGKLAATQYELQGQTITFSADALEKLGDYGTVTINTSGSGKASASVVSDKRIVYNVPMQ